MNIEELIKAVAARASVTTEQARKAVETVFEEMKKSVDENIKKVGVAAAAAITGTLVTTVMHKA